MNDETRKVKNPGEKPENGTPEELTVEQLEEAAGGAGPTTGRGSLGMDALNSTRTRR
jgi:hypothetical protein